LVLSVVLIAGCGGTPAAPVTDVDCCEVVVADVASGEIRGVLATRGEPSSGWIAMLRGASVPPLESRIDERGRFFFGPLPPGSYELAIESESGVQRWRERVRVRDGDALELVVELDSPDSVDE
jgi:hypothetical protein